ncbi:hypothetical protein BKA62DRAFT_673821 [Auriculariales sp. MPI-PUGE-AT-0066]|nr:hypothetical protein BKA62DRAFT_673821 [Auriculariales sp. MPI-PUGE-AT-0066]
MTSHTERSSSMTEPTTSSPVKVLTDGSDDEDNAFMRNKGKQVWNKIAVKRKVEVETETMELSSTDDGDSDEGATRKKRNNKSKGATSKSVVPNWTRSTYQAKPKPQTTFIDSSDDEPMIVSVSGPSNTRRKRARSQSSERPLTPPPDLTPEERARVRTLVANVIPAPPQKKQKTPPQDIDDFTADIDISEKDLDPELLKIQASLKAKPGAARATSSLDSNQSNIKVRILWMTEAGRAERQWDFSVGRSETFSKCVQQVAVDKGMRPSEIIVSYHGRRIFGSTTPNGFNMWADVELEACTEAAWNYQQTSHDDVPESPDVPTNAQEVFIPEPTPDPEGDVQAEVFRIIVRATTTVAKVLEAYLKKCPAGASLSAAKRRTLFISIDGDKADGSSTLGDYDLEDENIVDVFGM